jgi:ATP-dependent Clp protease ATP-binding subunit ClpX
MSEDPTNCGFCNRAIAELGDDKLIKGHNKDVAICSSCIQTCLTLIKDSGKKGKQKASLDAKIPKPTDIKKYFDEYIIDQNQAKITIAVAVCDHYKRIVYNRSTPDKGKKKIRLDKSNVLLIGPTGTGKTEFARRIADYLKVPFAIGDATSLTEAGYVGDDVENLLLRLLQAADGDVERAENGIIFIDEIDKIASAASSRSTSKDVGGEGVQQALLKILEGTIAHVPPKGGRKHPEGAVVPFDTSNVLFIGSGAFVHLKEIIDERVNHTGKVGFSMNDEKMAIAVDTTAKPEDLVRFGLIPEFVGRFPVIASLQALNEKALRAIFTEVKDSLYSQYQLQFKLDSVELELTEKAIQEIVSEAIKLGTGARGLRAVAEKMILPYKYRIEDYVDAKYCQIDGHLIEGNFLNEQERAAG